jgi:hypothetical protein
MAAANPSKFNRLIICTLLWMIVLGQKVIAIAVFRGKNP